MIHNPLHRIAKLRKAVNAVGLHMQREHAGTWSSYYGWWTSEERALKGTLQACRRSQATIGRFKGPRTQ